MSILGLCVLLVSRIKPSSELFDDFPRTCLGTMFYYIFFVYFDLSFLMKIFGVIFPCCSFLPLQLIVKNVLAINFEYEFAFSQPFCFKTSIPVNAICIPKTEVYVSEAVTSH